MILKVKNSILYLLALTATIGLFAQEAQHIWVKPGQVFSIELRTANKTSTPWIIYKPLDDGFVSFEKVEKIEKGTWLQKLVKSSQCSEKWTFQAKQNAGDTEIEMFQYQDGTRKNEYTINSGALSNSARLPEKFIVHIR